MRHLVAIVLAVSLGGCVNTAGLFKSQDVHTVNVRLSQPAEKEPATPPSPTFWEHLGKLPADIRGVFFGKTVEEVMAALKHNQVAFVTGSVPKNGGWTVTISRKPDEETTIDILVEPAKERP